ncbi:hypothetical protein ACFWAP_10975 [Streptomyces goshikiensis]|uniref:hypothetical protein n=1 Tax=Streptomyces goshikiensis TaxID=1942 RepID=UPI003649DB7D
MPSFDGVHAAFLDTLAILAPESHEALRPPAVEQDVARVLEEVFNPCPTDVVALFSRHDGAEAVPAGYFLPDACRFLSLGQVCEVSAMLTGMIDGDDVLSTWWHPKLLPFAADVERACAVFVDLREGEGYGSVGFFSMESGADPGLWGGIADFVGDLLNALEGNDPSELTQNRWGDPILRDTPEIVDGRLEWV